MEYKNIKNLIKKKITVEKIFVSGNNKHLEVVVVSKIFHGMSQVKRQQEVYKPLMKYFFINKIHSINISTYSLKEWEIYKKKLI